MPPVPAGEEAGCLRFWHAEGDAQRAGPVFTTHCDVIGQLGQRRRGKGACVGADGCEKLRCKPGEGRGPLACYTMVCLKAYVDFGGLGERREGRALGVAIDRRWATPERGCLS